ncbi:MAG: thioredoxin family protein [Nanoarchaeota archaeon]|nr:thioredoxin family protein [Nanoarchaeota archaeon]
MKKLNYLIAVAGLTGILMTSQVTGCSKTQENPVYNQEEHSLVTNITTLNQLESIISSNQNVAVDFGTTWCPPCKQYEPVFKAAAEDYKGKAVFCKATLDKLPNKEDQKIMEKYQVTYIPKTMLFKNGKPVHSKIGYIEKKELSKLIDTWLLEKK